MGFWNQRIFAQDAALPASPRNSEGSGRSPKLRLTIEDRFKNFVTRNRIIDGLRVGGWDLAPSVWSRLEAALTLIKTYDRSRYDRFHRDLDRIIVAFLFGSNGRYNPRLNACELDERFLLRANLSPEIIAAVIVHEATHARLWHLGIGYEEKIRTRVEAVCIGREIAFASRLPNGKEVEDRARRRLANAVRADFLTNQAIGDRMVKGIYDAGRDSGAPTWLIRSIINLARTTARLRGLLRRSRRKSA